MPRSVRAKARAIEHAYSTLENELRRTPRRQRACNQLGISEHEFADWLSRISFVALGALDEILLAGDLPGASNVGDMVEDPAHDSVAAFEVDEMKHLLADAINRAPTASASCAHSITAKA